LNCSNPFLQNVPAALAQSIIDENSQLKLGFSFEYLKQKSFIEPELAMKNSTV
jgi:hypothetical protein